MNFVQDLLLLASSLLKKKSKPVIAEVKLD